MTNNHMFGTFSAALTLDDNGIATINFFKSAKDEDVYLMGLTAKQAKVLKVDLDEALSQLESMEESYETLND